MMSSGPRQFNHARLTAWNLAFHYAHAIFLIVYGVVLTPLYLSTIPEKTFGVWLATGNVVGWLSLVDPGLNAVVQQRIAAAYARGDSKAVGRLRTHSYALSSVLALAIGVIGLIAAPWVSRFVGHLDCELPNDVMTAYCWACVATGMMTVAYGAAVVNIGLQAPIASGLIYLASQAGNLFTILWFLHDEWGVVSIPLGLLVQALVLIVGHAAYSAYRFKREAISASLSLVGTAALLRDSRGTIMSRLAGSLAANTDMLVAATFLGPVQALAANMTQKGPGILRTLIDRISHAAMPSLSAIHSADDLARCSRSAATVLRTVIWMAIPAAVGILLLNRTFVALWVGKQHYAGDVATGIIAATVIAMGLEVTLSNLAMSFGLFQANGRVQLVRSGLTSLLAVLLTWSLGVRGLLAAPLVAGVCTTWWMLPRFINQTCGWGWRNWLPLALEAVRVLTAAGLAAGAAAILLNEDVASFLVTGFAYVIGCVTAMAAAVPMFRDALSRAWSKVSRRLQSIVARNRAS